MNLISLDEFIKIYTGQVLGYPTNASYPGQCLSLVKRYIKECFGVDAPASGTNSAYGYWSRFPNPLPTYFNKVVNTLTYVPKRGEICIWKPTASNDYCGHIDIVLSANVFWFTGLDQNWGGRQAHEVKHNYINVEGFLVPKKG